MSRKVHITVTSSVKVPMLVKRSAIVIVDEGVSMDKVARVIIGGKIPDTMDVEDSSIEHIEVDGMASEDPLDQQVSDLLCEENDDIHERFLSYEIEDSK